MNIITIAAGIVLAVIVIRFWWFFVSLAAWLVVGAVAVAVISFGIAFFQDTTATKPISTITNADGECVATYKTVCPPPNVFDQFDLEPNVFDQFDPRGWSSR